MCLIHFGSCSRFRLVYIYQKWIEGYATYCGHWETEALAYIICIDVFLWLQYRGLHDFRIYLREDTRSYSE